MGCTVCFSSLTKNCCVRLLEFWACPKIIGYWIAYCLVWRLWFALSVFLCDGNFSLDAGPNILAQSDCVVRHAWFALSVFFCDGKFFLKIVQIFTFFNYSWRIRLQIVLLGMHDFQCMFVFRDEIFLLKAIGIFCLINWMADCLVCIMYIVLSWWKILAQGCWNFELIQKNIG